MSRLGYDLIILGGGSAGIVSGVAAGGLKLRTLLIERFRMGGECLNTGCVPSKALVSAARLAYQMRRADEFGLPAHPLTRADATGVMALVRERIRAVSEADATTDLLKEQGVELCIGSARFTAPDTIEFEGESIRAEHFILATGSRPTEPSIPGLAEAGFLTNSTLFSLDEIPASMIVLGGGPIGVEMAQAFQRLGCSVTLVQKADRLLPRDDDEVSHAVEKSLVADGVVVRLKTTAIRVESIGNGRRVHLQTGAQTDAVDVEAILVAVGRSPNLDGLNVSAAGVELNDGWVRVDNTLHTTGPRTWACGDIIGWGQFSHMAEVEAKLVVQNIFLPAPQRMSWDLLPWATFTDPEAAHVGLTESEARARGRRFEVHRQPFWQDDRAVVERDVEGFVKILCTPLAGKILGAHIVGPRAGELIQEFVMAMRHGLSIRQIADLVHVYPTLGMANQHAAQRWYEARSRDPIVQEALRRYQAIRPAVTSPAAKPAALALGAALAGLISWRMVRRK